MGTNDSVPVHPDDVMMTTRLKEAGDLLGIPVVDHIVLGRGCSISMAERGLL
jgi:DNA repair protein RadC